MDATLKVEDPGGSVVIGQVHLAGEKPLAELYYDSAGNIEIGVEQTTAGGNQLRTFLGQVPVGTLFSYEINYSNNQLSVSINGGTPFVLNTFGVGGLASYFKAGAYGQTTAPSDVHFFKLQITHAGTINTNGWYKVVNVNSGLCADVFAFGTALGTSLDQWQCGNGQANQQWQLTPVGNGIYQVSSRFVAMSWNVTGGVGATGNQVPIQLWSYGGASNEQWQAVLLGADSNWNGIYKFIAQNSGLCLDVPSASKSDGQQLDQFSCNGTNAQAFTLVPVTPALGNPVAPTAAAPPPAPTPNPNAWYNVVNVNSGLCVDDLNFGTALGSVVDQWSCGNGQANQQWQLTPTGNGSYQVSSRLVAMSWNITGGTGATGNTTPIQLWSFGGASNEQWKAAYLSTDSNGNNVYQFIAENDGLCLDVPGASTSNGQQLDQFSCNGTNAQAFTLVQVNPAPGNPVAPTAAAPPPPPTPNPNAWYNVVNVNDGSCVDVFDWGTALGTRLDQWTCGNDQANQQWQLTPVGNGVYQVHSRFVTMSWNVTGGTGATGNQTPIQLWSYGGNSNEQWQAIFLRTDSDGNNVFKLIAQNSGLCLDVPGASNANGLQLDQFSCNGSNAQAFTLVPVTPSLGNPVAPTAAAPPPAPTPDPNAWYNVVNVNSGLCVDDLNFGTALGSVVDQWSCGNGQANQQWQLTPTGNGSYQVSSRFVAMSWDVTGGTGATGNQTPIQLWSYGGRSNEQWQAVYLRTDGNGNNVYNLIAQNSGLCLDVPGASNANGQQLDQFSCNGTNAQAFTLVQVNPAPGNPVAPTAPAPPPPPTPNPNAWYNVVNVNDGSCVDVFDWGTALGTRLDQWTCGNDQANQQWQLTSVGNGVYQVHSRFVAMSWNVTGGTGATGNQTPIQLWSYGGDSNEQWKAVYLWTDGNGNNVYRFVAQNDGLCLDVPGASNANGLQLDQFSCNGTNAQAFTLVQVNPAPGNPVAPTAAAPPPTSSPTPPPSSPPPSGPQKLPANSPIGPGAWAIQNVNSGLCLDVFGGQQTAGAALDQWPCGVGPSQQWWFSPASFFGISYNIEDGYGTIIDVAGGPSVTWNQAGIDLWTMNDQTNDQWVAVRLPSGAYNFVSVSSGKCLDVPFSSTSQGLRLDQYDCNGTNAQAFWVYPAPTSSAGGSSGGGSSGGNGPGGGCSIGPLGTACRQPD
ncbi:hypothetical protein HDF09_004113 [Edaphobacter lichenicola]|uniref:Ricin B lectin domain-containing protein n=1 Tax=Tunturiibacter empetritectus TaxID=3069691 RepID=A0A7W8MU06_9BACT|nr:hypothetical protein [Edaphobacter lichenicola]